MTGYPNLYIELSMKAVSFLKRWIKRYRRILLFGPFTFKQESQQQNAPVYGWQSGLETESCHIDTKLFHNDLTNISGEQADEARARKSHSKRLGCAIQRMCSILHLIPVVRIGHVYFFYHIIKVLRSDRENRIIPLCFFGNFIKILIASRKFFIH